MRIAALVIWMTLLVFGLGCVKHSAGDNLGYGHYKQALAAEERGDLNEAERLFRESAQADPDFASNHFNLGLFLKKQNRLDEAIDSFEEAGRQDPNFLETYIELGGIYEIQGKQQQAADAFRMALAANPKSAKAELLLGITLSRLKEFEEAEQHMGRARSLTPDDPQIDLAIAINLWLSGQLQEAESLLLTLTENPAIAAAAFCRLGGVRRQLNRPNDAEKDYLSAIQHDPREISAYYNLACLYAVYEQPDKAINTLKQAIELDPKSQAMAAKDTDFDTIRQLPQFQALMD